MDGGDITVGEVVIWLVATYSAAIFLAYLGDDLTISLLFCVCLHVS